MDSDLDVCFFQSFDKLLLFVHLIDEVVVGVADVFCDASILKRTHVVLHVTLFVIHVFRDGFHGDLFSVSLTKSDQIRS